MQHSGNTYLFFGVVGAGKGTQIDLLQKHLSEQGKKSLYLYPGNEFRALTASGSFTAGLVNDNLVAGKLQPNFITDTLVAHKLIQDFTGEETVIFDGYPRSIHQAKTFVEMVKFYGLQHIKILFLDISEQEAVTRMMERGRSDDTEEGIRTRLAVYKDSVLPSMEYLKSELGLEVVTINGEQTIPDVFVDVIKALEL